MSTLAPTTRTLRLTRRAMAAWARWREAETASARSVVGWSCDLVLPEMEALDRLAANVHHRTACDLLITCVDSAKARRDIYRAITQHRSGARATPHYWLDLGNRQSDGQVILGEPVDALNAAGAAGQASRLPTVVDIFPELLDESLKEDDRPSCSLAESLETQDLFVNDHVSRWALQLLWTLLRRGRIQHHGYFLNLPAGEVRGLPVPGPGGPPPRPESTRRPLRRRRANRRAMDVAARRAGR